MLRKLLGPAEPSPLAAVLLPPIAAAATFSWHLSWLQVDESVPLGDAGGHLVNVIRQVAWLGGDALPVNAFPPAYYTLAAAAVDRFGPDLHVVGGTTAAFAALLAFVVSWLGARTSAAAGVLAPLLVLASPMVAATSRQVLLDLPMTAMIVLIWALAHASEGFRRPVPTVLVGVALAAGALVKYTLFPWVLPALVIAGAQLVVRAPLAVLPLGLVVPPAVATLQALQLRTHDSVHDLLRATPLHAVNQTNITWLVAALGLVLGCTVARRRWAWLDGPRQGAWLAASAILAISLVAPWFLHAMPAVWEKVEREAIEEVRTTNLPRAIMSIETLLRCSWPQTTWLVGGAVSLELVWWARALWERWAARKGGSPSRPAPFGPLLPILASCAGATWFTLRMLPIDVRYYLPLLVGAGLLVGVGLGRTRLGGWLLAPAAAGLLGWQLYADRFGEPARLDPFDVSYDWMARLDTWGPFAPPRPRASPLVHQSRALLDAMVEAAPRCATRVVVVMPRFEEARALGLEGEGLVALAQLRGLPECAFRVVEVGHTLPQGAWVAVVGVLAAQEPPGTSSRREVVEGRVFSFGPLTR